MNFNIIFNNKEKIIVLSKLGLNVYRISVMNRKQKISIEQIANTVEYVRELLLINEYWIIDDVIYSYMFKNATLFNGIYPYVANFDGKRLIKILENEDKKQILIDRLNLMLSVLTNKD